MPAPQPTQTKVKTKLTTSLLLLGGSAAVFALSFSLGDLFPNRKAARTQTVTSKVATTPYFVELRQPQQDATIGTQPVTVTAEFNEDRPIREVLLWEQATEGTPMRILSRIPTLDPFGQPSRSGTFSGTLTPEDPVSGLSEGHHAVFLVAITAAEARPYHGDIAVLHVDKTAPEGNVLEPEPDTTVPEAFTVRAYVVDPLVSDVSSGVGQVQFLLDDQIAATMPGHTEEFYTTGLQAAAGTHTLAVRARDAVGNERTSDTVTFTVAGADTIAPTVQINSPTPGSTVTGAVPIYIGAVDQPSEGQVTEVKVYIDNLVIGTALPSDPPILFLYNWDTRQLPNNSRHTIKATARDAAGNTGQSEEVTVNVATVPLEVSFFSHWPGNPERVSGVESVVALVQGSQTSLVSSVDVKQARSSPANPVYTTLGTATQVSCALLTNNYPEARCFLYNWDTRQDVGENYNLKLVATPTGGAAVESNPLEVYVTTDPRPIITSPADGATVNGVVAGTVNRAGAPEPSFCLEVDGQCNGGFQQGNAFTWDTQTVSNGQHLLRVYIPGGYYSQYVLVNVLNPTGGGKDLLTP